MILIILFSLFLLLRPVYALNIPVGETTPDFTLSTVDGKAVSLSEYKGKIGVLIYWRTSQNRSLLALEDGQDIFKRYKKKGVQVIGLIADTENHEDVRKIIKDYKIDFPVLLDSGRKVYGDYGIRVYPSTVIISRDGKLAYDIPGHSFIYKMVLEGYLRYMLGEIDEAGLKGITTPGEETKDKSTLEAERMYHLALKFTEAGLIDQSIETVKKSIEAEPNIARSHILLGFLFLSEKEADKAVEQFKIAMEIEPLSHDAKTGLGGALILKGDIDSAIGILTDATVANPYPEMAYYELGRAYQLKDERDKSIEMYKKALDKLFKNQILPSAKSKCR